MTLDPVAARDPAKTALGKRLGAVGRPITYAMVLAALPSDEARSEALARYRGASFTPDEFGHRRSARAAMLEALVAAEDLLEARYPRRDVERADLRDLRRRLEVELCP